jgi:hypothetical protein
MMRRPGGSRIVYDDRKKADLTWIKESEKLFLDGAQVCSQGAGIVAAKAKRRHIGMTADQAIAQLPGERVQVDAAIEVAKGGSAAVRACTKPADRVALGTHAFRQCKPVAL